MSGAGEAHHLHLFAQPLEGHEARTLCGHESVCFGVEWAALSSLAHGLQGGEAHMDEEIIRAVDRTRQRQVHRAIVKLIDGELDGIKRACAGSVQAHGTRGQPQGSL